MMRFVFIELSEKHSKIIKDQLSDFTEIFRKHEVGFLFAADLLQSCSCSEMVEKNLLMGVADSSEMQNWQVDKSRLLAPATRLLTYQQPKSLVVHLENSTPVSSLRRLLSKAAQIFTGELHFSLNQSCKYDSKFYEALAVFQEVRLSKFRSFFDYILF